MAKQAIKYENTTVAAVQSANEITSLVQRYGAREFSMKWNDQGELVGIRFTLKPSKDAPEIPITLPAKTEKLTKILMGAHPSWSPKAAREQAQRVAWRHIKDLTEQLLLAAELEIKGGFAAVFMGDIEVWDDDTGGTVPMYEYFHRHAQLDPARQGVRLLPSARGKG